MFSKINMNVNGEKVEIVVEENECLLDTLHDKLGLTSVKRGCEVGECGACTVLIDGIAKNACIYLSLWADGCDITTVEGLRGIDGDLHPVQKAFIEEAATQCGFCTPGLILSAVAILNTGKMYNRAEIRKLISGHLCRCTGYENILRAVEKSLKQLHG